MEKQKSHLYIESNESHYVFVIFSTTTGESEQQSSFA